MQRSNEFCTLPVVPRTGLALILVIVRMCSEPELRYANWHSVAGLVCRAQFLSHSIRSGASGKVVSDHSGPSLRNKLMAS
jgi:hypothetical protein